MVYETTTDGQGRPTRRVFSGCDYYFKDGEDFGQSFDDVNLVRGEAKRGKWMNTEAAFDKLLNVAMEDYRI